jgi:hypothetical protein
LQKKTEIRAEKGQGKKVNLGWHRDRKENPITAPSIHVGAVVGADSLWTILYIKVIHEVTLSFTPYSVCFHSLSPL